MHSALVILSFLIAVSLSHAAVQNVFNFQIPRRTENEDLKYSFKNLLNSILPRFQQQQQQQKQQHGKQKGDIVDILINGGKLKQRLTGFSYKSCGVYANVTKLVVLPDPLQLPGDISVSATVNLTETLDTPLKANVTVWLNGALYFCTGEPDSPCQVSDVCDSLKSVTCPQPLQTEGIPCKCPFKKKVYNLPSTEFNIDIPAEFLSPGNYHVKAEVYSGMKKAACIEIDATLED